MGGDISMNITVIQYCQKTKGWETAVQNKQILTFKGYAGKQLKQQLGTETWAQGVGCKHVRVCSVHVCVAFLSLSWWKKAHQITVLN
eukprot:808687-Pelagomonas_calceolata.AAC.1